LAHPLALATLGATCVLILLGGLVTNTGAALAVPDWPSTFGYNMVLFPWSRMVGGVLYEHSHRLMGALVGLLTVVLAGALWREGGRLRWLGFLAVAAVVSQGVLGGLRVEAEPVRDQREREVGDAVLERRPRPVRQPPQLEQLRVTPRDERLRGVVQSDGFLLLHEAAADAVRDHRDGRVA